MGWWLRSDAPGPSFYAYTYPEPPGYRSAKIRPAEGFFDQELGEFILPYDAVRGLADPDGAVLEFLEATHAAGADLAGWDRPSVEPTVVRTGLRSEREARCPTPRTPALREHNLHHTY